MKKQQELDIILRNVLMGANLQCRELGMPTVIARKDKGK